MYSNIKANKRNTVLIIMVFLLVGGAISSLIGYYAQNYAMALCVMAGFVFYALMQYFTASRTAMLVCGGREIVKKDCPELWRVVENLCIASGLPMPRIFIIDDDAPNAFATGRNPQHAYVAVTTGLLAIMDKRELEAVMSHELSHIQNYDIRISMIVFGLSSAIAMLCDLIYYFYRGNRDDRDNDRSGIGAILVIISIVAPIIVVLLQLAVSRQREYLADASGALMTRDPEGLASALEKLKANGKPMRRQRSGLAPLYFNNPSKPTLWDKILQTHPPLDERIARLRSSIEKM